jgi:LmbE family N-acetylglucosaminyl deacetylase
MIKPAQVMVVTPHPDDAEFGAAGTVACLVKEGKEVVYIVCTNGNKGTSDRNMKPEKLAEIREREQKEAARVLGVREVVFLGYNDQELEDTPELRKRLVRLIRTYRPETVITVDPHQHYLWWHRDHRICGQAVMDAIFPYARDQAAYPDLLKEGIEPHKVKELLLFNTDKPNYRVDITGIFGLKLKALSCHKSQLADFGPELRERLKQWSRETAKEEEYELAEAFNRIDMWW